jgi:hypothetical protein
VLAALNTCFEATNFPNQTDRKLLIAEIPGFVRFKREGIGEINYLLADRTCRWALRVQSQSTSIIMSSCLVPGYRQ